MPIAHVEKHGGSDKISQSPLPVKSYTLFYIGILKRYYYHISDTSFQVKFTIHLLENDADYQELLHLVLRFAAENFRVKGESLPKFMEENIIRE
ncbi:Nascent Polypeptide-Associated Complex Subunit Alpha-2 [Manis pentadactyla]|nr:Nascent Polypeptide-Associated Complex Subunit Alpha-2 [Manis pentadactyla]